MPEGRLVGKLAEVMAEVGHIEKRGRNDFHKYDYVLEADVLDALRDKLAQRKIMVLPSLTGLSEREVTTDKGKRSTITTTHVRYSIIDGESGETLECDWAGQGDDPGDKGSSKAFTGSEKSFLLKAFLIPTGDDPEADQKTDERAARRADNGRKVEKPSDLMPVGSEVPLEKPSHVTDRPIGKDEARVVIDHLKGITDGAGLRLIASDIHGADIGDCETIGDAVNAVAELTPMEREALERWAKEKAEAKT